MRNFDKAMAMACGCLASCLFGAADPDGLVAAYDFRDAQDGFVRDYGPNANPGILHSLSGDALDALTKGKDGGLVFRGDGNGNYMTVPDHAALRESDAFTVEMVCTIHELPKGSSSALVAFESTRARLWANEDGTISMDSTPDSTPNYFLSPRIPIEVGRKLHVFAFISGNEMGVAVNGELKTSSNYRGSLRKSPGDISVGGHPFRSNRYVNGTIEKVLFYNRRLANEEMTGVKPSPLRPSASSKTAVFEPDESVAFVTLDGIAAETKPTVDGDAYFWDTGSGRITRRISRVSLESRRRILESLMTDKKFPSIYTDALKVSLDNRMVARFDSLHRQMTLHERQLFKYADRLHALAEREFDEDFLRGKKNGLPPIMTELPPFSKPAFRELVYQKAKELYARNFLIDLRPTYPRIADKEQMDFILAQGEKVSTIGPIVTNPTLFNWMEKHPDLQETGYSFSDDVATDGTALELSVAEPFANTHYDPYRYWQVRDETTKIDVVPRSGWTFDAERFAVTVKDPMPGHRYAVYYCARHGTGLNLCLQSDEQVKLYHDEWRRFCEQHRGKILFHHTDACFHYFTGKRMKWWEFWGYNGCNANPSAQAAFEEFSGMRFRPAMLFASLDGPAINYTPTPELLAWMAFNQKTVTDFARKTSDIAKENGIMYQFYWGDKHLGFEPDLDAFERSGVQSVARPLQDAVDVRSMTAQNGKALTSGRLEWLFSHMVNRPDSISKIFDNWQRNRRGELFRIRDMHYFAEFVPVFSYGDAPTVDLYMRLFKRVNEEFLLMHKYLHGEKVFTHGINVYAINEWGKQYSWRPWRDQFLRHFTDMPINLKWISLREIAEKGVPSDATVLLNYGNEGSAWVGTTGWKDLRVAANIRRFVAAGGGFLGVGAAACVEGRNQLPDVLGFNYVQGRGGSRPLAVTGNADPFLVGALPITLADEPFRSDRNIAPKDGFRLLASADGASPIRPLVGENRYGNGRSVYISFMSREPKYGDLLKRAIFAAAGRESDLARLYSVNPAVQAYAYPTKGIFILNNDTYEDQATILKLDTSIFPMLGTTVKVINLIDKKAVGTYSAKQLAAGVEFRLDGATAEYFVCE